MIFSSLFNNSSEKISLESYDKIDSKVLNYITSATLPDQQDLEQLKKLDIRIGIITQLALSSPTQAEYGVASKNRYSIDIELGQGKSVHAIVANIDPNAVPSLVNRRVAVLINLKPDCDTGNTSSYVIQEFAKEGEKGPQFTTIITPSEQLICEGKLLFSEEDFKVSLSNNNHHLLFAALTLAVVASFVFLKK